MTPAQALITAMQSMPAKYRAALYVGFTIVGFALGAVQVALLAASVGQPVGMTVALAVYGFVAPVFGLTATVNVDLSGPGDDR